LGTFFLASMPASRALGIWCALCHTKAQFWCPTQKTCPNNSFLFTTCRTTKYEAVTDKQARRCVTESEARLACYFALCAGMLYCVTS
jgi:hypothetical protein